MSGKKSGIRICREEGRRKRQRGTHRWEVLLSAFFTAFLSCAWWAGLLSVFPFNLSPARLYAGIMILSLAVAFILHRMRNWGIALLFTVAGAYLWFSREAVMAAFPEGGGGEEKFAGTAAAIMTLPLLWLWVLVLRRGKGKLAAGLLMAAPMVVSACAGYFPSVSASWLLFFAGGMYYVFLASGRAGRTSTGCAPGGGKNLLRVFMPIVMAGCIFAMMMGLSVFMGKYLDKGREVEGSFYQLTRAWIHSDVIGGAQRLIDKVQNAGEDEAGSGEPHEAQDSVQEQGQTQTADETGRDTSSDSSVLPDTEPVGEAFGEAALETGSAMRDLKAVSSFIPEEDLANNMGYILPEKPTETVYFPLRNGIRYVDDSWTEREADIPETETFLSAFEKREYTDYPSDMKRLEELCEGWDKTSLQAVAEQINETLASMAVYDTNPGPTPGDQNFPEYFLFENKRGFCVHFATTATLLYRMCGYPARYAEGYAIPPSAFRRTENGYYDAEIDGSMGHAWSQVFDEEKGEWLDMEHTPSASGVVPKSNGGLSGGTRGGEDRSAGAAKKTAAAGVFLCGSVLLLAGVTVLQASMRRKRLLKKLGYRADGSGALVMYDIILRTAHLDKGILMGKKNKDRLSEGILEKLKYSYPGIKTEEWDSLYMLVMRGMFGRPSDTEEDRRRWERACRFFWTFTETAKESMGRGKRFLYRYVYCLEPLIDKKRKM